MKEVTWKIYDGNDFKLGFRGYGHWLIISQDNDNCVNVICKYIGVNPLCEEHFKAVGECIEGGCNGVIYMDVNNKAINIAKEEHEKDNTDFEGLVKKINEMVLE